MTATKERKIDRESLLAKKWRSDREARRLSLYGSIIEPGDDDRGEADRLNEGFGLLRQ